MACQMIPFPQELRPQLPTIVGNVDYLTLRQRLEQIDALLHDSGAERDFVQRALRGWTRAGSGESTALEQEKFQRRSRRLRRPSAIGCLPERRYPGSRRPGPERQKHRRGLPGGIAEAPPPPGPTKPLGGECDSLPD